MPESRSIVFSLDTEGKEVSQVHEEIRAWLLTQPDWLQEAADRLLNQGRLHDQDIAAVAELLKTEKGREGHQASSLRFAH